MSHEYPTLQQWERGPRIVAVGGGTGLSTSHIMMLNPSLISKTGAGGFLSIYNDEKNEFLLVKMAQDNNTARFLFTLKILEKLNWIKENPLNYSFYDEGGRVVGEYFCNISV